MHPTVSPRWLLTAIVTALASAVTLGWLTLCLLFWQGSWQLLYHPAKTITQSPTVPYDPVGFAATPEGLPQLHGWWIAAPHDAATQARFTVLYLHGAIGNLSDAVSALEPLHAAGLNIFAIDYRGFGQSNFARPSEAHLREDTESALAYLTNTRHIPMNAIILAGQDLGANLALESAAAHSTLAGVILHRPVAAPTDAIFNDPRAKLVPAHLLVRDRWDTVAAASSLRIPSLWFTDIPTAAATATPTHNPPGYEEAGGQKTLVWVSDSTGQSVTTACRRWRDELTPR